MMDFIKGAIGLVGIFLLGLLVMILAPIWVPLHIGFTIYDANQLNKKLGLK